MHTIYHGLERDGPTLISLDMLVLDTCSQYVQRTLCLDVLTKQHWSDHPAYNVVKDMVQHEMPHPSEKMVQCNLQFDSVSFEWLLLLHNSSNDFGIMTPQDISSIHWPRSRRISMTSQSSFLKGRSTGNMELLTRLKSSPIALW